MSLTWERFQREKDSFPEQAGFEPSVPLTTNLSLWRKATPQKGETESLAKALSP